MSVVSINDEVLSFNTDVVITKKQALVDGYDSSSAGLGANNYWFGKCCLIGGDVIPLTEHYEASVQHMFGGIVTVEDGTRFLKDNGGNGGNGINTPLHNGQGVKFNGEDQFINAGIIPKTDVGAIFINFQSIGSDSYQYVLKNWEDDTRHYVIVDDNELRLGLGSSPAMHTDVHIENGDTVCITHNAGNFKVYVNGVLKHSGLYDGTVSGGTEQVVVGAKDTDASDAFCGILNEVILMYGSEPTGSQIKEHFRHPEHFLYLDKELQDDGTYIGVLKSKILQQNVIDNVVVYYPMNDKNYCIRDLVNYTEEANLADITGTSTSIDGDNNTAEFDSDNNKFVVHIENATSDTTIPALTISNDNAESGNFYYIEGEINVSSGSTYVNKLSGGNGTNIKIYTKLGVGVFKYSGIVEFDGTEMVLTFNGKDYTECDFEVKVTEFRKIGGTSLIENYTDSCRDDAAKLDYGRQDILNIFDSTKIPIKSNLKSYECRGGNVLDLRLTDTELNSGDGFVVEVVVNRKNVDNYSMLLYSRDSNNGMYIYLSGPYLGMYAVNMVIYDGENKTSTYKNLNDYIDEPIHLIFKYDKNELKNKLYVNGDLVVDNDSCELSPSGLEFGDNTSQKGISADMNYFKLWYGDNYNNFDLEKSIALGADAVKALKGE